MKWTAIEKKKESTTMKQTKAELSRTDKITMKVGAM